jgi:uroporphyrin-III C-methyltransferase/precorrin-2 dehydrogenase/sirohydrochlorin ferrochelatase
MSIDMDYLPINIDLKNKDCLILGAGAVAYRKMQMLLKVGAKITCIGLKVNKAILSLSEQQQIKLINADLVANSDSLLNAEYIKEFKLVISTTGDSFIAQKVFRTCELNHILINTVDNQQLCNYISPAIVNRSPILVSISSSGTAPVLARNIREKIEKLLPNKLGLLANKADKLRAKVKSSFSSMLDRKKFWESFFESSISEDIINQRIVSSDSKIIQDIKQNLNSQGEVALVGAGPGDPELLTIKALRVMQKADIVFHDRLVSDEILELVRRDAELVSVGKTLGNHSVPQDQINQLLVKHAQLGKRVVRLKGGDPFVFGRGGEELQELKIHGIKFQIIPGITAAVGCSAYAGIPLTHRDYAQNVLFVTAHCKDSRDTLDWQSLAREKQTIAVYMGLMKSDYLADNLIRHGKNPETPVALIENGTCSNQRVIRSQLKNLPKTIQQYKVISPSLIIIGEVAALADDLQWFNPHIYNNKIYSEQKIA